MKKLLESVKNYNGEIWVMKISEKIFGLPKSTNEKEQQKCYRNAPVKDVVLYFNDEGNLEEIEVGYELCYSNEEGPNFGNTSYDSEKFTSIEEMSSIYAVKKVKEVLGVA